MGPGHQSHGPLSLQAGGLGRAPEPQSSVGCGLCPQKNCVLAEGSLWLHAEGSMNQEATVL